MDYRTRTARVSDPAYDEGAILYATPSFCCYMVGWEHECCTLADDIYHDRTLQRVNSAHRATCGLPTQCYNLARQPLWTTIQSTLAWVRASICLRAKYVRYPAVRQTLDRAFTGLGCQHTKNQSRLVYRSEEIFNAATPMDAESSRQQCSRQKGKYPSICRGSC